MTNLGSTIRLKLVLTDNSGDRVLYEEPMTYTRQSHSDVNRYLEAFATGVYDAISDLDRYTMYNDTLRSIPDSAIEAYLKSKKKRW